jgi:hypothetical protein
MTPPDFSGRIFWTCSLSLARSAAEPIFLLTPTFAESGM